jgi:tellurite resistance protein TehA-like permease
MWITGEHDEAPHLHPARFSPAVGNVPVPLVGARSGDVEVGWPVLSMGLPFCIVLLTIGVNRLIFHPPMPPHLLATRCILIAPPAVAFLAYGSLAGEVDGFARLPYDPAVVFFLLVAIQRPRLWKLPFGLSWWAYSFRVAALTVATFVMAERTGLAVFALGDGALYCSWSRSWRGWWCAPSSPSATTASAGRLFEPAAAPMRAASEAASASRLLVPCADRARRRRRRGALL